MSKEFVAQFAIDEVSYFLNFIKDNIGNYRLSELTNGNCGDIPSINGAHPLALEYGNRMTATLSNSENYTSILPAIGVEFIDDNEHMPQLLGSGHQTIEITQAKITALNSIAIKDRIKNGVVLADTTIANIQAMKDDKDEEPLYAGMDRYIQDQSINISIWSFHIDVTRILFMIIKSLLKRAKRDLSSKGVKNLQISGQGSIYNYDFGQTLFGAEFHLTFISPHENLEVDDSVTKIIGIEETLNTGLENTNPDGVKLNGIGG